MKLEEEILADRAAIAHHLAHLAALARGHEKAAALAEGHKARGIDSAVEAFVRLTVKETVNTEDGTTEVLAQTGVSFGMGANFGTFIPAENPQISG